MGIRLGIDISIPGEVSYKNEHASLYKSGAGFSVTGLYHAYLNKKFYFEPGLNIFYNTTGIDANAISSGLPMNVNKCTLKNWGIRIPLSFGIKFPIRTGFVSLYTGPTLSYGIKGTESVSLKSSASNRVTANMYEDYNRFDFCWHLGVGVSFNQYYIGMNWLYGLTNQLKHGDGMTWSNNVSTISVGYNF